MMGDMIIPRELLFLLFVLCYYIAVVSGAFFIKSFWTKRSVSYRVLYFLLMIAAYSLIRFFVSYGTPDREGIQRQKSRA